MDDSMNKTFFSLFTGAGGLDIGLEEAGWTCGYASDVDPYAVETLKLNKGLRLGRRVKALDRAFLEQADVRSLGADDILAKSGLRRGDVELLAGGPPCQSWSSAGRQLGLKDPRGTLFEDFVRIANGLDVRWLLFENVRGLVTARGIDGEPGSALRLIRERLLQAGFQTHVALLNAADHGVPQRRVRLFLFGYRQGDPPPFPKPTHRKNADLFACQTPQWVTLGEVISSVAPPHSDEIYRPSGRLAEELADIPPGSGVKSPGKAERTRPNGHWGYKQGAFVADLLQSARTVTANQQQDWIRDPQLGLRRLSPRECAAIQTFPANWQFAGSPAVMYRLIGNAVPPLLAKSLGKQLKDHVKAAEPANLIGGSFSELLPLPQALASAIDYTRREEASNGLSRRVAPSKRPPLVALAKLGAECP